VDTSSFWRTKKPPKGAKVSVRTARKERQATTNSYVIPETIQKKEKKERRPVEKEQARDELFIGKRVKKSWGGIRSVNVRRGRMAILNLGSPVGEADRTHSWHRGGLLEKTRERKDKKRILTRTSRIRS